MSKGPLIILSGPSGSGKSTLIAEMLSRTNLLVRLSISATTRAARPLERDGVHYYFWSKEEFLEAIDQGRFLEWAEVHGHYYGTLSAEVEPFRNKGTGVILDIDVQGARQVASRFPEAVKVFLKTSTWEVYEQRIRRRGTENEAAILRRLETARRELACIGEYQFVVINDDEDLGSAVDQLLQTVQQSFV